ncbi:MAG: cytidine deaminase [Oscillospiraceae bacterium]
MLICKRKTKGSRTNASVSTHGGSEVHINPCVFHWSDKIKKSNLRKEEIKMDEGYRTKLIDAARESRELAHCPYSHYKVGAAVLGEDGIIYRGCNIENVSYGATVCAERTAMFGMVAAGCKKFSAIAVATGDNFNSAPCCLCRQVMLEFCDTLDLPVIMTCPDGSVYEHTLRELAPMPFMAFEPNSDYSL